MPLKRSGQRSSFGTYSPLRTTTLENFHVDDLVTLTVRSLRIARFSGYLSVGSLGSHEHRVLYNGLGGVGTAHREPTVRLVAVLPGNRS